jgi:succinate-acetate transporter protein
VSLGSFLKEPLQGKTSLSAVFWLYGLVGSILVSAIGLAVDPGNEFAMRVYTAFGLLFSVYVTIATYQCASNCQSKFLARLARISAVASLVALPVLAYLYYSGAIGVALVTLGGEQ